jgi:hypothetical protein
VTGIDQDGRPVVQHVVHERPLTIFLNSQEVVTAMTIGDHPDWLAVGYLVNQGMLTHRDEITGIDHDEDLGVVVVRTSGQTDFEEKMKKKVRTSGCAQGTVFGDIMETFETIELSAEATLRTSWLYALMKTINTAPSLYLKAGAIHGCVLAQARPGARLYRGRRAPQCGGQDRRLDVPQRRDAARQDLLHHRPADVGDGHQVRGHGHSHPRLALRASPPGASISPARPASPSSAGPAASASWRWPASERIVFDADVAASRRKTAGSAARPRWTRDEPFRGRRARGRAGAAHGGRRQGAG